MSSETFDLKGFWERLCQAGLQDKPVSRMSREEVISLLNAAECFTLRRCFRCPNFVPDFDTGGREGRCRLDDSLEIADCQDFCVYGADLVPF